MMKYLARIFGKKQVGVDISIDLNKPPKGLRCISYKLFGIIYVWKFEEFIPVPNNVNCRCL